jgi:general secretion pathway protein C
MSPGSFDLDRLRRAAPAALLCCVLLGAVALWLVVRLGWALLPRSDDAVARVPLRVAGGSAQAAPDSIARWHLFGQVPGTAGGASAAAASSLVLRGTFAGSDPASGIAVIAAAGEPERAVRAGEDVVAGVRLAEVHADRVVLSRNGVEETLVLPRDRNFAPADVVRPTPGRASSRTAAPASSGNAPASAPATSASAAPPGSDAQQTLARLRRDPAELARRVQVVPVMDGTRMAGVRLAAGGDAALLGQLGLQPGDVVTAVNGLPVDSLARGQDIMAGLANARSVRVTVQRGGTPTDLTIALP